jgi:hypothetical protein
MRISSLEFKTRRLLGVQCRLVSLLASIDLFENAGERGVGHRQGLGHGGVLRLESINVVACCALGIYQRHTGRLVPQHTRLLTLGESAVGSGFSQVSLYSVNLRELFIDLYALYTTRL